MPVCESEALQYPRIASGLYFNDLYLRSKEEGKWIVGSETEDTHFLVTPKQKKAIERIVPLLDGKKSVEEIAGTVQQETGTIEKMIRLLARNGLICGINRDKTSAYNEVDSLFVNLFRHEFKPVDPHAPVRTVSRILTKASTGVFILSLIACILLFRNHPAQHMTVEEWLSYGSGELSSLYGYLFINFAMILMFGMHEIGHIVAGLKNGIRPDRFCFSLYLGFTPMFYVKNKNMYALSRKSIVEVLFAGCYVNFLLGLLLLNGC